MSRLGNEAALEAVLGRFDELKLREADVYVEEIALESISVADGEVESVENKLTRGASVRVLNEGRVGFAFTTDLTPDGVDSLVRRAQAAALHAGADDAHRLPETAQPSDVPGNHDPKLAKFTTEEKVDLARRIEAAARRQDPRVSRTREASYQDVTGALHLGRAGGYRYDFRFTRAFGYVDLIAEEGGESQSGAHVDFAIGPAGLDAEIIGREAARRAVDKLGGRPCPTRRASLLLSPDVVDGLLESLAPIFFADDVLKGKSLLAGKTGESVAAAGVSLVDAGRMPGGCNSAPVDGEGVATGETVLIEAGVLRGFLHDGFSARKMGEPPTGNGMRESFFRAPATQTTALSLRPTGSRDELYQAVADGLLIEEVMGLHTINPISGDFSVGASGRAVRNGEPGAAVAGIGMAGNVRDLLNALVGVGDDVRLMASGNSVSTILLEGLSVSGE